MLAAIDLCGLEEQGSRRPFLLTFKGGGWRVGSNIFVDSNTFEKHTCDYRKFFTFCFGTFKGFFIVNLYHLYNQNKRGLEKLS